MATVKVKLHVSKPTGRQGNVVYHVTHRKSASVFNTGYKLFPDEWDDEFQSVVITGKCNKGRNGILRSISFRISRDMERFERIINIFNRHSVYTAKSITQEFARQIVENSLLNYMGNIIVRLRRQNRIGTANNYRAALNSFMRFTNNRDVPFDTLDHNMVEEYQAYLVQSGIALNSVSFYMRILRAVYNRAVSEDLTNDCKPFRNVFTGKEKTLKRAITIKEIKKIKDLNLSAKPNLEFARDVFMFLFYCRGLSFIDAAFMKKKDLRNGILSYRRSKTNQLLHIKVIEPIRMLIDRYSSRESPYLLDIITNYGADERKQYEAALRRVNNALKEIAKMVKLQIPLTTYVSRHAWATIAKSKNVPVNVISDALGHDSISTTQIYLATIDMSAIDKANELVLKGL